MTFYPLASDNWNGEEKKALQRVINSNRFTMGREVQKFEKDLANFHKIKNAIMTNSGSSANLLMIAALIEKGEIVEGDEVIVPAVSWSTTFFPLHQYKLKIVFVDTDLFGNIDSDKVKKAVTNKTKVIFAVNLLGFPANLEKLLEICNQNNLLLIEDNCESFGAKIHDKLCGTWGKMGTLSFFFSHHITTMEGGCILTDDDELAEYLRVLRAHGWIRDTKNHKMWNKTGDEFKDSFRFVLPGYCLRPLELNAAVGQVQLKKWPLQKEKRLSNAKIFVELMTNKTNIKIPEYNENSTWFGFPMIMDSEKSRSNLIIKCKENGIETRPIVAGNFLNQPVINRIDHKIKGSLANADIIDKRGLFFGNDGRDLSTQLKKLCKLI